MTMSKFWDLRRWWHDVVKKYIFSLDAYSIHCQWCPRDRPLERPPRWVDRGLRGVFLRGLSLGHHWWFILYVVSWPACAKNLELTLPKVGDPLQPQLVGPLHHLMLQGFCQRLAEGATKAFHEDGPFRPCQPTIGKPSHPKTAILIPFFFAQSHLRHLPLSKFFYILERKKVKRLI